MKRISYFLIAGVVLFFGCKHDLKVNGRMDYQIVIPAQADTMEIYTAEQLQHYLFAMSNTSLPIVNEDSYNGNNAIYLGRTGFANTLNVDFDQLKKDGYAYKTKDNNFIIAGGSEKGLLYGVYDLLEYLGFRKYTPDYTFVPKGNSISLPENDTVVVPLVRYRTTSYLNNRNPEFFDWHKQSSRDDWGMFVHTFEVLIPPQKYGKTHPEYFSLIDGKRSPVTQLCLSNEEVFKTVVAELKKRIAENPKSTYWSVSQNDNDKYCQCESCKKLNEKYGGVPSGSMIWFVNKVAREFPDKVISTLAYWYTRSAPRNIEIEPNVNIMLCNIESTREQPVFVTDPAFSNDLRDWGKISQDILIWDYNIQFASPVSPFPNYSTIGPNIKFYTNNTVRSLFMQAGSPHGEFGHLRGYLIAKLMWNPDADPDTIINDFLNGYYGAAGTYLRQYIDAMSRSLLENNSKLEIFGDPRDAMDSYLSVDMLKEYNQIFDKAEDVVKKDSQLLRHVQEARLPLMFAEIEIASQVEIDKPNSLYMHTNDSLITVKPEMKALVSLFVERAKEAGIVRVRERSTTVEEYSENFKRIYAKMDELDKTKSFRKKIIPVTTPGEGQINAERLTDGLFGLYESWRFPGEDLNWVGYKGVHMDFVLDLGEVMPVSSIDMDFLNVQAQADWNLLILPEYVTYATSVDGKIYSTDIKITNPHNPNPAENRDIVKIPFQSFSAKLINKEARYIKVHAENPLKMPSWHINAGSPAVIYSDEIVVK